MNDQTMEAAAEAELPEYEAPIEFQSVCITIDHLVLSPDDGDGETPVKTVWSNFPAADALLKQIDYFVRKGETVNPFKSKANMLTTARAAQMPGSIYIFTPSARLTNVIMDHETFSSFVDEHDGTVYGAVKACIALALGMVLEYQNRQIETPLLVATREGKITEG